MGRWEPDSRGRLHEAALRLYAERGFDQTTVAEIADAAGVTERTFFRHFADKREVLFGGAVILRDRLVAAIASAPPRATPLRAVASALDAAAAMLGQARRDMARQRLAVVTANPELRERELAKLADLADAMAVALRARGVGEPRATLAAETGIAALRIAMQQWVDADDGPDLATLVRTTLAEARRLGANR